MGWRISKDRMAQLEKSQHHALVGTSVRRWRDRRSRNLARHAAGPALALDLTLDDWRHDREQVHHLLPHVRDAGFVRETLGDWAPQNVGEQIPWDGDLGHLE